jgi:hypothetical protein
MARSSLHRAAALARRPFVISEYSLDVEPEMPSHCLGRDRSAVQCRLRVDHRRARKTGPGFPLVVVRCEAHRVAFTLYPPGHVPHGRVAIAPVNSRGELPRPGDRPVHPSVLDWQVTVFEAALDAASGRAWPRSSSASGSHRWRTQCRRIAQCALLLGLRGTPPTATDHADALGIPSLALFDAMRSYALTAGYRARGAAIRSALGALPISRRIGDRLVRAGTLAGLWGEPFRCERGDLVALIRRGRAPP